MGQAFLTKIFEHSGHSDHSDFESDSYYSDTEFDDSDEEFDEKYYYQIENCIDRIAYFLTSIRKNSEFTKCFIEKIIQDAIESPDAFKYNSYLALCRLIYRFPEPNLYLQYI